MILNSRVHSKLGLLVLTFLAPIALLTWLLVDQSYKDITFASKEQNGSRYIGDLHKLLLPLAKSDSSEAIKALGPVQQAHNAVGADMNLGDSLGKATSSVNATGNGAAPSSPNAIRDALAITRDLIGKVGDGSNLILDPDLDSFYCMDLTVVRLPQSIEQSALVLEAAGRVGGKDKAAQAEMTQLQLRLGEFMGGLSGIDTDLERAYLGSPDGSLKKALAMPYKSYRDSADDFAKTLERLSSGAGDSSTSMSELTRLQQGFLAQADAVFEVTKRELDRLLAARIASLKKKLYLSLLAAAVAVLLACMLTFQIARALNKMVNERLAAAAAAESENEKLNHAVIELLQTVSQVSQRDLTAQAQVNDNIIGTVADSLNVLTRETAQVLKQVRTVAQQVSAASNNMKAQADTVSETAEAERKGVESMISDLDTATLAMIKISELAENSNQAATQAIETTRTAQLSVSGTVKGMGLIRDQISEVERRIKRLGERSQEIGQILGLINTISERTHALALNASIQAAMAGDAGRGFAVVAEEVQRLSESARAATSQITQLVQNIQLETSDAINTVNKTIEQVVNGSQNAEESGELMQVTQETTARLVELVKQIAGSAVAQEKMAELLRRRADEINASTVQTSMQVAAQNENADILVSSAKQLVSSVLVFKLPA